MLDLGRIEKGLLDDVAIVVEELERTVGLDTDCVLVVGAACRDILHSSLGHTFPLRGTNDTDLGIAVNDWAIWERIDQKYTRIENNGIRYLICDLPVDIMPFGAIEEPDGVVNPKTRGEDLVVFGFQDVYERAMMLTLPNGSVVRIPHPAGYAALKMRSWIDRSVAGEDKDAKDLALVVYWYQESSAVNDRLYDTDSGVELLQAVDFDTYLAAVDLLMQDVAAQLSQTSRADLSMRWASVDLDLLERSFLLPAGIPPTSSGRRREFVAHLAL